MTKLADGRYRLRESIIMGPESCTKLPLKENTLVETVNGLKERARGAYCLKIWNEDFNKNKRSYKKVIPIVIQQNKITLGFTNHPDDGKEDVNQTFAVQKNPRIVDGYLCADVLFVGERGQLAVEILEAGGYIELSSSCLGDVDYEGYVTPDGFELERYGDWVWNASNALFQFTDQTVVHEKVDTKIKESENRDNNLSTEEITILKDKEKNSMPESITEKVSDKSLVLNIRNMLKEADTMTDPRERLAFLTEMHGYTDGLSNSVKLVETINNSITKCTTEIESLVEKGKSTDSLKEEVEAKGKALTEADQKITAFGEEVTKLKEQVETLTKLYEEKKGDTEKAEKASKVLKVVKAKYSKLSEKYLKVEAEKNTMADPDRYAKLCESNKQLVKTLAEVKAENSKLKARLESLSKANTVLAERQEKILNRGNRPINRSSNRPMSRINRPVQERKNRVDEPSRFVSKDVEEYFETLVTENPEHNTLREKFEEFGSLEQAQLFMVRGSKVEESRKDKTPSVVESVDSDSIENLFKNNPNYKGYV
jgi:uncharacterized protein YoxC/uncharacterized protein YdcH (DUF465 family)